MSTHVRKVINWVFKTSLMQVLGVHVPEYSSLERKQPVLDTFYSVGMRSAILRTYELSLLPGSKQSHQSATSTSNNLRLKCVLKRFVCMKEIIFYEVPRTQTPSSIVTPSSQGKVWPVRLIKLKKKTFLHSKTEPRLPANAMPGQDDWTITNAIKCWFSLRRASATHSTRTAFHTRIIALLHAPSYKQHTGPVSLDRGALISLTS